MFDDNQNAPQGGVPQNLPMGEPEDLFAESDSPVSAAPENTMQAGNPALGGTSALDAGILKPKSVDVPPLMPFPGQPVGSAGASVPNTPPSQQDFSPNQPALSLHEPSMSRGILVAIIVILAILLVGGASWWVYRYLQVPKQAGTELDGGSFDTTPPTPSDTPENTAQIPPVSEESTGQEYLPESETDTSSTQPVDETVLFGNTPDTDNDGLDDKREATLGTNPEKVDSDNDELSDGDEVIIWGTNPLNADTDGDTYIDGKEVKSGFSPKGPGKLFEVKTSTSS